ncbi:MAG: hypothetical protein A3K67_01190 [Euryarchaeota archaeon RBG_16_62_10]|nr:MAG: hypothetical protein A3K67_01190 [Euryarchaeota archaeon RBG_16_62_10]
MNKLVLIAIAAVAAIAVVTAAFSIGLFGKEESPYEPVIDPADFVLQVDNPYFPLVPGTTFVYEGVSEDGNERNEMTVTNDTKKVMNVTCVVIHDRVWLEGDLIEETFDWYAQDKDGNVWYFGEDSREISNGAVVSTEGSWEAGVDGAQPGIVMPADPTVGQEYRQEYYKGEAEDMAEVLALNESVTVPYGTFDSCLVTKDWTPLEKGIAENKYYQHGVGLVKELQVEGGTGYMELVDILTG